MSIKKVNIVRGAYDELRISGLTVEPTPEYIIQGLNYMDDKALSLQIDGYDTGWLQPDEYGTSDPDDDAGIEAWLVKPLQIILADELATSFGKQYSFEKTDQAYKTLAKGLVPDMTGRYPDTLPVGQANQDVYSPFFYGTETPRDGS